MTLVKYIYVALFVVVLYYSSTAIGCTNYMLLFSALFLPAVFYNKLFDRQSFLLILFSITYVAFTMLSRSLETKDVFGLLLCPFTFYCFGRYIIKNFISKPQYIEIFFILVTIATSVIFYYYSYLDYSLSGVVNIRRELVIDGTEDKNATYYGLVGSIGLAGISVFFYNLKLKKSIFEYLLFFVGVLSTLCIIHLLNRTGLVVIAATILLLILYKLSNKHKFSSSSLVFAIAIVFISYYIIQSFASSSPDVDVFNAYSDRNESLEGAGGRMWRWVLGVKNLIIYPFGWSTVMGFEALYVHNLWLDIARSGGIIPFIIFLTYTTRDIKNFLGVYRASTKNVIAFLVLSYFLVFSLSSFVEPIIDGFVLYFYLYCLVGGCLSQYHKNRNCIVNI